LVVDWLWLFLGALAAGVANTLAGGGSLLTVPLLMAVGLAPTAANATNRVAVVAQSAAAVALFQRRGLGELRSSLKLLPIAGLGALGGAWAALVLDETLFRRIFGALLVPLAVASFLPRRQRPTGSGGTAPEASPGGGAVAKAGAVPGGGRSDQGGPDRPSRWAVLAWLALGAYAGFIQAGYGLWAVLVMVHLQGLGWVRANVIKSVLSGLLSVLSLVVFAAGGQVDWAVGAFVAVASALGGYLGGLAVVRRGQRVLRWAFMLASVPLAAELWRG
jgi:uncharacterized membrane protein YfcA